MGRLCSLHDVGLFPPSHRDETIAVLPPSSYNNGRVHNRSIRYADGEGEVTPNSDRIEHKKFVSEFGVVLPTETVEVGKESVVSYHHQVVWPIAPQGSGEPWKERTAKRKPFCLALCVRRCFIQTSRTYRCRQIGCRGHIDQYMHLRANPNEHLIELMIRRRPRSTVLPMLCSEEAG